MVFQLYENNGVVKREEVQEIVKLIPTEERKNYGVWELKLEDITSIYLNAKPKAVGFRVSLWKIFHNLSSNNKIPKSGLNFLIGASLEKKFLLLCGFENLENFSRIDILEKLFS